MIRINQLKLSIHHKPEDLTRKAAKLLRIRPEDIRSLHIVKQSVDARKKEELLFIYTVDVETGQEENLVRKAKNVNIALVKERPYQFPSGGDCGKRPRRSVLRSDACRGGLSPDSAGTWNGCGCPCQEGC